MVSRRYIVHGYLKNVFMHKTYDILIKLIENSYVLYNFISDINERIKYPKCSI